VEVNQQRGAGVASKEPLWGKAPKKNLHWPELATGLGRDQIDGAAVGGKKETKPKKRYPELKAKSRKQKGTAVKKETSNVTGAQHKSNGLRRPRQGTETRNDFTSRPKGDRAAE